MIKLADMNIEDTGPALPREIAAPWEALRNRASEILLRMEPRRTFPDGTRGYKATSQTTIEVVVGTKHDDPNAPRERFEFPEAEFEIQVHDPVFSMNGTIRLDLEIKNYRTETISKVLFPGQTVALGVGTSFNADLAPSIGRLEIPLGVEFGPEFVRSQQFIHLAVETPIGVLHNPDAGQMQASVNQIPPVGSVYHQKGLVPMANAQGEIVAIKTLTETKIVKLLPLTE